MNRLIVAVRKQKQIDEGGTADDAETVDHLPNIEQQKQKRKLSFDTSGNRVQQSATIGSEMEQTRVKKQKGTKVRRKATGEKENTPANAEKDNRKEKEVAKAKAAEESALQFFKSKSDASLLKIPSMQPDTILSPN